MVRRVTLAVAAGLLLTQGGCLWRRCCGDGGMAHRGCDPCHLSSRGPECCDGVPVGGSVAGPGIPGGLVPGNGVPVLPGPTPVGPPNELPMPTPSDLIPRQGVPYAPPSVAPDPGIGAVPGQRSGQPVRTGR